MAVNKIDSNATEARFAEELTIGNLVSDVVGDGDRSVDIWYPIEPNEYNDFGGQVSTVARNPINSARQRKKGVPVNIEADAAYTTDITQTNMLRQLRGFMFADYREKADTQGFAREVTYDPADGTVDLADISLSVTGISLNEYTLDGDPSSTATGRVRAFGAGALVYASGMTLSANNGLKSVASVDTNGITVNEGLTDDGSANPNGRIVEVGFQFAAGDAEIDASSGFPTLTTTAKDLTTLGLIPGEWVFIGGDGAALRFTNAANNGLKRVRSISTNAIVFDKSTNAMVTETDAGDALTVQLFFGRVIKNESNRALQKRRSLQFERVLGFNDDSQPTREQAEYVGGNIGNELSIELNTADKITAQIAYLSTNSFTLDEVDLGANTLRSKEAVADGSAANAPAIVEADAFNTSSDVIRIALTPVVDGTENPTPLFAFVQQITLGINNNASRNNAIGVFGAFDVTVGTFEVDADLTAYFTDVAAIQAVRDAADVSFDFHLYKANAGISFDLPLVTLGDGRPNVAQDEPITIPITNQASTGAKVHPDLDHTLLIVFWDYLPALADS